MLTTDNKNPLRLEGKTKDGGLWVVHVVHSPFIIGRKEGSHLLLASEGVSRKHTEILKVHEGWLLRDCGSTNGTYINGKRLSGDHLLRQGDYITIAEIRFDVVDTTDLLDSTIIINPFAERFERMLDQKAVLPHFQPLVSLPDRTLIGYEILGRIDFEGLPNDPGQLFQISRRLSRQIELSELFRDTALDYAARIGVKELVLFNTLPEEMHLEKLDRSLRNLRQLLPGMKLGMELHENTVTDVIMMKELKALLQDLDMLLVYDDFGSGQSRLSELLDSVPDILKFDINLIKNIHQRSQVSRSILESLVKMARDAGIQTLAEGVECREEADVCTEIRFDLVQGYYFGRPAPL